jgi:glycosyltransferase involved in cell wall biosynthesis
MHSLMINQPVAPPWDEGSMNFTWQIARRVKRHAMHLLTLNTRSEEPEEGIIWEKVYSKKGFSTVQKIELLKWMLLAKPDIPVYHLVNSPALLSSILLRQIVAWRRVVPVQTITCIAKEKLRPEAAKRLYFADYLIVMSDHTQKRLRAVGIDDVRRINAGIDIQQFSPREKNVSPFNKYGIRADYPVILFCGEYSRLGSIDLILKALPNVVHACPGVQVVFACRLKNSKDVKKEKQVKTAVDRMGLNKNVHFLNTVQDMVQLLSACTVFLLPVTHMNGKFDTPMVVLEAMAMEKPVIITDIPPLNEVFKDDIGFLVPQDDEEALAKAIVDSLSADPQQRKRWGQNARRIVCEYYNIDRIALEYEKLYDEIEG